MGGNQYILRSLLKFESGFIFTLIHIGLGFLATISSLPIIAWFYFLLLDTARAFIVVDSKERNSVLAYAMVYFASFELIGRMSSGSPYIPYEASKYIMMLISIVGILFNIKNLKISNLGFILLVLLLPSLFIDESGQVVFSDIIFNLFGILNIALALIFFSMVQVDKWHFVKWIRLIAFPIIPVLIFTFLKTPDFSELEFEVSANQATSGGFGSNQVSTVLGLGSFLFATALLLNYRITQNKIFDLIFLIGFTVQGLLTFSRGGMIGAAIGFVTLGYFLFKLGDRELKKFEIPNPKKLILPAILAFTTLFIVGNIITSGNLILRYQGQTEGTIRGNHEVDLNKFTTNRWQILVEDLLIWYENPVFGSGAASSKYLRINTKDEVAHVEFSRLIAEHGFFGLLITLLFFRIYFNVRNSKVDGLNKAVQLSFFMLAIFTSFHAATRTFLTPLLLSLSYVGIVDKSAKKTSKKTARPEAKPSLIAHQI